MSSSEFDEVWGIFRWEADKESVYLDFALTLEMAKIAAIRHVPEAEFGKNAAMKWASDFKNGVPRYAIAGKDPQGSFLLWIRPISRHFALKNPTE